MGKPFFLSWFQNLGRNGWDQPSAIPDTMTAESYNIELREGGLGVKRRGFFEQILDLGGVTTQSWNIAKFVPGNDQGAAELWFWGADAGVGARIWRVPGGIASGVSVYSGAVLPISFAQLNNKFFAAFDAADNRIRVYAPNESATTMRLAGLIPEAAPTVANTGAGAYPAVIRTYRTIVKRIVSGVVVSQSEPSATVSFTPSGGGTAARVTKGAATGEGETHWCVEAASANGVYYQISGDIAVATTTYDDSVTPANYSVAGLIPPVLGSNYPFPSVRFLLSDGVRLLGLGVYETSAGNSVTPVAGRLYFTPAFGSSDMGDDERIQDTAETSGWIDLNIGGGGKDTGLGGPVNNAIVAFQWNGVYLFIPTNNADTPYRRVVKSTRVGSVSGASVVMAEDDSGNPALYFLDPSSGPYRITSDYQLEWLGKDVKDLWDTAFVSSTTPELHFWGVYDSLRKIIIWKCPTAAAFDGFMMAFDITNGKRVGNNEVRGGWTRFTDSILSNSGIMFPSTLDTPRPYGLRLWMGSQTLASTGATAVFRSSSSATMDNSVPFQAYIRSKAWRLGPLGRLKRLKEFVLQAKARAATTVNVRVIRDWGEGTPSDQSVSIASVNSSTYVRPRPNPEVVTDLVTAQFEIGDTAAVDNYFEIDGAEAYVEVLDEKK